MKIYDAAGRAIPSIADNAATESGGNLASLAAGQQTMIWLLQLILKEQQIQTMLLAEQSNFNSSAIDALREDPTFPSR